jgi:hypothetical protein
MVDGVMSILGLRPARNWSEAVATVLSQGVLAGNSESRTGLEPRQSSEPTVNMAGMELAYQRMLQAKQKLTSSLQMTGDVSSARVMAQQVAAAAQEYVSLGGRSSALLEPALPISNTARSIQVGDVGLKAYDAANSAVKTVAANDGPQAMAKDEPVEAAPPLAPITATKPDAPAQSASAPVPMPSGGLSLKV